MSGASAAFPPILLPSAAAPVPGARPPRGGGGDGASEEEKKAALDTHVGLVGRSVPARSIKSSGHTDPPAPQPSHSFIARVDPNEFKNRAYESSSIAADKLLGPLGVQTDFQVVPHDILMTRIDRRGPIRSHQTPSYPSTVVFACMNGLPDDAEVVFSGMAMIPRDGSPIKDDTMTNQTTGEGYPLNSGPLPIAAGQWVYLDPKPWTRVDDLGNVVSAVFLNEETKGRLLPATYPFSECDPDSPIRMMDSMIRKVIDGPDFIDGLCQWGADKVARKTINQNAGIKLILESIKNTLDMLRHVGKPRPLKMYGMWRAATDLVVLLPMIAATLALEETPEAKGNIDSAISATGSFLEHVELLRAQTVPLAISDPHVMVDNRGEKIVADYIRALKTNVFFGEGVGIARPVGNIAMMSRMMKSLYRYAEMRTMGANKDHLSHTNKRIMGKALEDAAPGKCFKILLGYSPGS